MPSVLAMEGAGHTAMQYHAESTDLFSGLEASSLAIFRACSVLSDMAVVSARQC
jgi:hypothetical protein